MKADMTTFLFSVSALALFTFYENIVYWSIYIYIFVLPGKQYFRMLSKHPLKNDISRI